MTKASAPESSAARLLRLSRQGMAVLLRLNPYMERQEGYSCSRSRVTVWAGTCAPTRSAPTGSTSAGHDWRGRPDAHRADARRCFRSGKAAELHATEGLLRGSLLGLRRSTIGRGERRSRAWALVIFLPEDHPLRCRAASIFPAVG